MLLRYLFHSIIVLIGKQKGEKEMSSDSWYQFFRPARRMSGEKDAPKRICMQLRYLYLSQFFSYWLGRESGLSDISIYSDR
jgi:hypothetical protein